MTTKSGRDEKASRARLRQLMGGLASEEAPSRGTASTTTSAATSIASSTTTSTTGPAPASRPSRKVPRSSDAGPNTSSSTAQPKRKRQLKPPSSSSSSSSGSSPAPPISHHTNWSTDSPYSTSSLAQIALWGRLKVGGFVSGPEDKAVLTPMVR